MGDELYCRRPCTAFSRRKVKGGVEALKFSNKGAPSPCVLRARGAEQAKAEIAGQTFSEQMCEQMCEHRTFAALMI